MSDERRDEERIDLPLGGEEVPPPTPPRAAAEAPAEARGGEPQDAGSGERSSRLPIVVLVALGVVVVLALAALAGYLLPRPAPPVLRVEPALVDFGPRSVASPPQTLEVVVGSTGERPARIEAVELSAPRRGFEVASEACSGSSLAPGASCAIPVTFAPAGPGTVRTTLEIRGDFANSPLSVVVLGEGLAPHLAVDRRRLELGERPVVEAGSAAPSGRAPSRALTVTNDGTGPVTLEGAVVEGPAAEDFAVSAAGCAGERLDPADSCSVSVTFAPTAVGPRRATLRLRPGPGAAGLEVPPVGLTGTGLPAARAGALSVEGGGGEDGPGLAFGAVALGDRSGEELRVANRGDDDLLLERVAVTEGAGSFTVTDSECRPGVRLAPGERCRAVVRFAPENEGELLGVLTVTAAQSGAEPGAGGGDAVTVAVPLRGRGVVPRLVPEPVELSFGESRVGREGPSREVALASTGSGPVEISRVGIAGVDSEAYALRGDSCSGRTLEPGERCSVEIVFRPRQEGVQSARLDATSPSLPEPAIVRLQGAGAAPRIRPEPPALEFGRVAASRTATREVTVVSAGRAPVEVRRLEIVGDGAAASWFTVAEEDCTESLALAPGETCDATVRFAPRAEGEAEAVLAVVHDGPGSPHRIPLSGTALPAPAPRFEASPSTVRFGEQPVGERSAIETVTVRNEGTERMVVREVALAGPDSGSFRVVPGTCEGAAFITPGSECTVGVRFVPAAPGPRSAELVFRHDAEGAEGRVRLEGVGEAPSGAATVSARSGSGRPVSSQSSTSRSAICTALRAAPFLRLSATHQKARPRSVVGSRRMRPT